MTQNDTKVDYFTPSKGPHQNGTTPGVIHPFTS
jgi:hypothetical protein